MKNDNPNSDISSGKIVFQVSVLYSLFTLILTYGMFFMGIEPQSPETTTGTKVILGIISWGALVGGIFFAQKYLRDESGGGYISFGKAFSTGLKIAIFSGLLSAILSILYYNILNPDAFESAMRATEAQMAKNPQMDASKIDAAMTMTRKYYSYIIFGATIVGMVIIGSIISLIGAAIFKKDAPVFIPEE